jgi:hypothetical protein
VVTAVRALRRKEKRGEETSLRTKDMKIEFLEETTEGDHLFQVVDHTGQDPRMAMVVLTGLATSDVNVSEEPPSSAARRVMSEM